MTPPPADPPKDPVVIRAPRVEFLERDSYRQRRLRDAARLLPVFAVVMMCLPLMWPRSGPDQSLTSSGMIYLFGLWFVLVALAYLLSRVLRFTDSEDPKAPSRQVIDE